MRQAINLFCAMLLILPLGALAQKKTSQVPPCLIDETFRLTKQCYFFQECSTLEQRNKWYILAVFLSREAVRPASGAKAAAGPQSSCGPKFPQVRLYRFVNDTTVVFCDSLFINSYRASVGSASAFDNSGLQKIMINQACDPSQSGTPPLLCYAISVVEITERGEFRNLLRPGSVPERWIKGMPSGLPLEPVVADNLDKTPYPELLAVDDFFEGDPAFRVDDFPKITLVYSWDAGANMFQQNSDRFPGKYSAPAEIVRMSDDATLVTIMERVMVLAAMKRMDDATKLMNLNMTPERFLQWKRETPERGVALALDRLKEKLTRCIERYGQ